MNQPAKVISAFVGVFIAGAVFGGLFTLGTARRQVDAVAIPPATQTVQNQAPQTKGPEQARPLPPARIDPVMMRQYTQRLSLTAEQKNIIRPFMARAENELKRLRRENLQDTTRTMNRMYDDIARNLTPEQLVELEKMKQTLQERLAEDREKKAEEAGAKKNGSQALPKAVKPPS